MIGQTISHYRIVEKLGEGGMGVVYLAEDTLLGRRVAIKTLHADRNSQDSHFRIRFLREARAVSALSHPHIATIHDYGETEGGQPYIVMELVKGETLGDLMQKDALTIPRAIEIISQVAEALAEAHAHGIIHRDIKPSNVAINERGNVKVLDFGLAKQIEVSPINPYSAERQTLLNTQTKEGVIVGTPMYLSPEQAMGVEVDARSDLFSLGSLLYECIAGKPPFSAASPVEICAQIMRDDPAPPSQLNPDVPKDLDRITLKALAKKPEERYQTADEIVADLGRARTRLQMLDPDRTVTRLIAPAHGTHPTGALATLSDIFKRPRLSIGYVAGAVIVILALVFGISWWTRATLPKPSVEAQNWYDIGTNELRQGTYFKAIKPLEQAIVLEPKFVVAHARLAEVWAELDYTDRAQLETLRVDSLVPNRAILSELDALYLDSIRSIVTRDIPAAIKANAAILKLKPNDAQAYVDLGRAFEKNDQLDEALNNYEIAFRLDPQHAAPSLRLGILRARKQDGAASKAAFDSADALFQTLGDFEGRAEVLYQRGLVSKSMSQFQEADDQLRKALEMARASSNQYQQIGPMLALSAVLSLRGQTEPARTMAMDAVTIAQNNGIENLAAQGLVDLGLAYLVRREYSNSEQVIKQALDIARRNNGRRNEAAALLSLAKLYLQQETRIDEAIEYLKQASEFFEKGGYQSELSQAVLSNGRAKLLKGDYDGALHDFQQVVLLAKRINDRSELANAYVLIGNVLRDRETYPEALANFAESYKLFRDLDNPLSTGYLIIDQAKMYWRLGNYSEANRVLTEIPDVVNRLDSNYRQVLLARYALVRAEMAASQQDFSQAKSKAEQAINLSGPQVNYTAVEAKSLLGLILVRSRAREKGLQLSLAAVDMAKQIKDEHLLSETLLGEAEAFLENNKAKEALATALESQERFARGGQQESEWRAWVIAAKASEKMDDVIATQKESSRGREVYGKLQQEWGAETFRAYSSRKDIQAFTTLLQNSVQTR